MMIEKINDVLKFLNGEFYVIFLKLRDYRHISHISTADDKNEI